MCGVQLKKCLKQFIPLKVYIIEKESSEKQLSKLPL